MLLEIRFSRTALGVRLVVMGDPVLICKVDGFRHRGARAEPLMTHVREGDHHLPGPLISHMVGDAPGIQLLAREVHEVVPNKQGTNLA